MKKVPGGALQESVLVDGVAFKRTFSHRSTVKAPQRGTLGSTVKAPQRGTLGSTVT